MTGKAAFLIYVAPFAVTCIACWFAGDWMYSQGWSSWVVIPTTSTLFFILFLILSVWITMLLKWREMRRWWRK